MPNAHKEAIDGVAGVLATRREGVRLDQLSSDLQLKHLDDAGAVVEYLYTKGILPRLPRS